MFERLRLIIVPALERISAAAAADQRQVCVLFFIFLFNYLFVYLFILPLFIYLLVVFSF
jgi:hypothetical protein